MIFYHRVVKKARTIGAIGKKSKVPARTTLLYGNERGGMALKEGSISPRKPEKADGNFRVTAK